MALEEPSHYFNSYIDELVEPLKTLFSVTPDVKIPQIKYIVGLAKATFKAIYILKN